MDAQQAAFLAQQSTGVWQWESNATAAVLAAVPNDKRDYKPDAKSRTAWEVATHIVASDLWYLDSIVNGAFAWDPDGEKRVLAACADVNALVAYYKAELPKRLDKVRAMSGEALATNIDFFAVMKQPAAACIASGCNHSVHHRAQLGTYLRSMGSKVPAIYGQSADTPMA